MDMQVLHDLVLCSVEIRIMARVGNHEVFVVESYIRDRVASRTADRVTMIVEILAFEEIDR